MCHLGLVCGDLEPVGVELSREVGRLLESHLHTDGDGRGQLARCVNARELAMRVTCVYHDVPAQVHSLRTGGAHHEQAGAGVSASMCRRHAKGCACANHGLDVNQRMDHGDAVGQAAALAPLGRQVRREQLDVLGPRWSVRRFARAHVVLWQRSLLTATPRHQQKMRR
jgi:hypothetical protein